MSTTLNDLHARMLEELEQLTTSEDWERMLHVARRFHRYSAANVMLILAQRPHASRVAGYNTWAKLGRTVRKGSKGIAILAPCTYRTGEEDNTTRVLKGFRVAHVFDIADTDGAELPEVSAELLEGAAPEELWEMVADIVTEEGYRLERADCSPANGVTNFTTKTVVVRPDLSDAQAFKTLCHELGHIIGRHDEHIERELAEVEAESVAFLLCGTHGLDSGSYTFPYVARWAGGNLDAVRATTDKVLRMSREIIARIESRGLALAS